MYQKQIATLRNAWDQDVLTRLITNNQYEIDETNTDLLLISKEHYVQIHFNYENTKYVTIYELDGDIIQLGKKITHFSLDKFFTPEMTVKVLHNAITELEHVKEIDLLDRVHGMVN
jgi:hypothetical protein